MGIEDFKRWHWIAISLVIGIAMGYVWSGIQRSHGRTVGVNDFVRDVTSSHRQYGPIASRIVIHAPEPNFEAEAARAKVNEFLAKARDAEEAAKNPPRDSGDKPAYTQSKLAEAIEYRDRAEQYRKIQTDGRVQIVTYRKLMLDSKTKKTASVDRLFIAEIPFVPPGERGTQIDPNFTVARYLDALQRQYPHVNYSVGWWTTAPAGYAFWTVGSVLAIGLCWPTLLSALVGAGYGRPHVEKYDLNRFKSSSHAEWPKPTRPRVSEEDQARLLEMTEKLEAGLAASGAKLTAASPAALGADSPASVRKLDGGPLEVAAQAQPQDDEEIEVKGEYYPVLIHHKKHHDEEKRDEH